LNHNTHENNNDVNIDYFLYSCYEHEQTLLSLKQEERLRGWDELGSVLESSKEELNLRDLLFNLINWYKGKYPVLLTKKKLNIEELNDITDPLCTLNHDIDTLYEFKCDEKIPPFEASVGNNRIWDHIKEAMTTHFPEHGLLYTRYIEWRHSSEKKMTPELFDSLASQGYNRIPVVREVLADLDTPLSVYLKLANGLVVRHGSYWKQISSKVVW